MPSEPPTSLTLAPVDVQGEPRIRDVDLAVRLGFGQARDIRQLIARHGTALSELGPLTTVEETVGKGHKVTATFLNRKQAIYLTTKSETPAAVDVTVEIIHRFDAYERGEVLPLSASQTGGIVKAVMRAALADIRAELHTVLAGYDPTLAVTTEFRPMLAALQDRDVGPKKRRSLSQRCSSRCQRWLLRLNRGADIRLSRETGRHLFRAAALDEWMAIEGVTLIAEHRDRLAGQGVMTFKPRLVEAPDLSPTA